MSPELEKGLADATHNPDQFWPLVAALRDAGEVDPAVIVLFARHPNKVARRAAAAAGAGNSNPYVVEVLASLADDAEFDVRQELAYALKNHRSWPMEGAVAKLLSDSDA